MFTSEMESMLAMLMLIPTMTGGPGGGGEAEEKLLWQEEMREIQINWRLQVLTGR